MPTPHQADGRTSFLFRAVCAIVFSTLLIESVATANAPADKDPISSMLETISALFSTTSSTAATFVEDTVASDSTSTTSQDPGGNPPPPPPPPVH